MDHDPAANSATGFFFEIMISEGISRSGFHPGYEPEPSTRNI